MGGIIGLVMIHGRSWMHFTDAIPGILVCVWMCMRRVGVWGRQKKAKIKVLRQNIWLPGNRASSNGSIKLWRMVVHDSTSPIRFQDGVGAGRWGATKTEKCLHLSWFVRAGEQWHYPLQTLSQGGRPWHINRGPQTELRFRGLLLFLGSIQVIYTACTVKMSSLRCLITCLWGGL